MNNEIEGQKRAEIREDFKLYLKQCVGIEDLDDVLDVVEEIEENIQNTYNKSLFDIVKVNEFDEQREGFYPERMISENPTEESIDSDGVLDYYHEFLIAYKFAHEWVKPRRIQNDETTFRNIIVFGAPGTGKSHYIDNLPGMSDENSTRVTFHPDSDYASFVGCYKPTKDENGELTYEFVPQAFTEAYINAWKQPTDKPYYLIIEEINRGNCAQIFGDLFQLLDRFEEDSENGSKGFSEYPIYADKDLSKYLCTYLTGDFSGIKKEGDRKLVETGKKLCLPSNLRILATMNTSDQSLYPMDSAFKRRWEWVYIPISYDKKVKFIITDKRDNGKGYSWEDFLKIINERIYIATKSEDKQLGFWFVGKSQTISESTFVNKVIFYLWNDVFKDYHDEIYSPFTKCKMTFQSFYDSSGSLKHDVVKDFLEKGLDLKLEENIFPRIKVSQQYQESQSTSKGKIQVTFPDGTIFMGKGPQVLVDVINKITPDIVRNLNITVAGGPLVAASKDEIPNKTHLIQSAKKLSNGMYVVTHGSIPSKIRLLNTISEDTGIKFDIKDLNQTSQQNEVAD